MNGVIAVEICVYKHIHTHILSVKSEHYGKFLRKSYIIPYYLLISLESEITYLLLYVWS